MRGGASFGLVEIDLSSDELLRCRKLLELRYRAVDENKVSMLTHLMPEC